MPKQDDTSGNGIDAWVFVRLFCTVFWASCVVGLSLLPESRASFRSIPFAQADKIAHALAYGTLALLLFWTFSPLSLWLRFALMITPPAILGAALEIIQPYLGRTRSIMDMAANMAGITAAVLGSSFLLLVAVSLRRKKD